MQQISSLPVCSPENEVNGREVSFLEESRSGGKDQPEVCGYQEAVGRYIHKTVTDTTIHGSQNGDRKAILRIWITQSGYVVREIPGRGQRGSPTLQGAVG